MQRCCGRERGGLTTVGGERRQRESRSSGREGEGEGEMNSERVL